MDELNYKKYEVTDEGIYHNRFVGTSLTNTPIINSDMIMPKEIFIKAFEKYIIEEGKDE